MRLDKWYYTNQSEHHAKHAAQQLVRYILGFPPDVYERKPVKIENVDLPLRDDLISMVIADGFPEWGEMFAVWAGIPTSAIAVAWTKLSCLREISENPYNTVLVTDNVYPMVAFDYLTKLLSSVPDDIHGLNLIMRDDPSLNLRERVIEIDSRHTLFSSAIGFGFYYLFTPEGAGMFLDMWKQDILAKFEEIILRRYQKDPNNFPVNKWYCYVPGLVVHSGRIFNERSSILTVRDHD